jgi:hypothetical protein
MFAALLTYLRDDELHFMMWLRHYRQHFPDKDIFVLDNMSKKPIASLGLGITVRQFSCANGKYFDHGCLISNVKRASKDLLQFYERVVFTEVDELLAAVGGLRNLICDHANVDVLRPVGFELLQSANETRLDYSIPILPQRTIGGYNLWYNKPAVFRKVLPFTIGFHSYNGAPAGRSKTRSPEVRNGLYLIHLKHADVEFCVERKQWQKQQDFSPADVEKGKGIGAHFKKDSSLSSIRKLCQWGPHTPARIAKVSENLRKAFGHTGGHKGWCEA